MSFKIIQLIAICMSYLFSLPYACSKTRTWYGLKNDSNHLVIEVSEEYLAIFTDNYQNGYIPATICRIHEEGCRYYRIASTHSLASFSRSGIKINTLSGESIPDSVQFNFIAPNYNKPFRIGLYYNGLTIQNSINGTVSIKLKRQSSDFLSQYFSFNIYPDTYTVLLPNNTYAGIVGCRYSNRMISSKDEEFIIDKNATQIDIELTGISKDYFNQFYIEDEYIKIEDDKLIWRGLEFVKTKEDN